ncbi:MAG: 4Fe-4S dicluster domain-containing protein [Planctomycetota bacterium]|jgi:ferredoxin|nr:4Fe-4S dicluster domain-containing protein [Planctomycetota bacterium]
MKLRKYRRIAAAAILSVFIALFVLDVPQATLVRKIALAATQISPGISRGGHIFLVAVFLLSAIFLGRVYCSLVCPAGLLQELFHHIGRRLGLSRLAFRQASRTESCLALLFLSALILLAGWVWPANLLDPVSLFGRLFRPLSRLAEGDLAGVWEGLASPFALPPIAVLALIPLFRGRWLCDRLCPIGMLLRLAASLPAAWGTKKVLRLSPDLCRSCGQCEKVCQTRCLDAGNRRLDHSRCVLCLDCLDACKFSAFARSPGPAAEPDPGGRRKALGHIGASFSVLAFLSARPLAALRRAPPDDSGHNVIVPPGTVSPSRHNRLCIACQACVPSCPMEIITPQERPDRRPILDFDRGFCQYDCFACRDSCPAGVFNRHMSLEEKKRTRISRSRLLLERCVVLLRGNACGACAEVCPTHAVVMVAQEDTNLPTRPDFLADPCIGCGACYHVCPAEPRAFRIEAVPMHETAGDVRRPPETPPPYPADEGGGEKPPAAGGEPMDFPF